MVLIKPRLRLVIRKANTHIPPRTTLFERDSEEIGFIGFIGYRAESLELRATISRKPEIKPFLNIVIQLFPLLQPLGLLRYAA